MGVKRILITGSNGLLGQTLVKKLSLKENVEVLATSRGNNRMKKQPKTQFASMDIVNRNEIHQVFDSFQPHIVINTAAMTNVDTCENNREACRELNVDAVKYLIEAAEKHQSHLIHLSTDFIFDGEDGPYREDDSPNPLSYYGESKLASESLIKAADTKWSIVRTVLVYGLVEDMSRSNIVLWAKGALEKKQKLTIVNDQFRTPTFVDDLADGCILIAEKEAEGIFNISGKDFMSIVEIVKRVAKFYGLADSFVEEISSETLNQAAKRPPKTGFILDKAKEKLGYSPHSFEEGMAKLQQQFDEKIH